MLVSELLSLADLHVSFRTYGGRVHAVRGVSLRVAAGECLALVGESGSGKSVTAQAIMRLLPSPPAEMTCSRLNWRGQDLSALSEAAMRKVRGNEISMIFQDPMTALNPTMTIGRQVTEGLLKHGLATRASARAKALEMLRLVGIAHPEERLDSYPHQFSGGMRQRVMIAMALACGPRLLIADEPTTALDVTIQAQILDLLADLRRRLQMAVLLITHDLGVVAGLADRVAVMYAGQVVEEGSVDDIFYRPRHPYTWGLLGSAPRLDGDRSRELTGIPGTPPDLFRPPTGCAFAPRCPHAMQVCRRYAPETDAPASRQRVACWLTHPHAPRVSPPAALRVYTGTDRSAGA